MMDERQESTAAAPREGELRALPREQMLADAEALLARFALDYERMAQ